MTRKQKYDEKAWREWNQKHAGKRADVPGPDGYTYIDIDGETYRADAVIWKWMTGEDPPGEILHINGDRADNRWENLRIAGDTH